MMNTEELHRQWAFYKSACDAKGIDAGTKEDFIKRNTPKDFKPDYLLEVTPKLGCLHVRIPLFKAEENITLSRRELRHMLEDAAQRGYELGVKESA